MRLRRIAERFPDDVVVKWRPFALRPVPPPEPFVFTDSYVEQGWKSAASMTQGDEIRYQLWNRGALPRWSMPALWAGTAAQRQGDKLFHRFHLALYRAFFSLSLDPTEPETVVEVARESGLDTQRFQADFADPALRDQVSSGAQRAALHGRVQAVPTVVVADRYRLQGAVSEEHYLKALADCGLSAAAAETQGSTERVIETGWVRFDDVKRNQPDKA